MACPYPTPPRDLQADQELVADGGFLRSPGPNGRHHSPLSAAMSRGSLRSGLEDMSIGNSLHATRRTYDPRLSRQAFVERLTLNSPSQRGQRSMFGRRIRGSPILSSNLEVDPSEGTWLPTGSEFGNSPEMETSSPYPRIFEYKYILIN